MSYYVSRSKALQDIAEMLQKGKPRKKIYYVIGVTYGFGPKAIDQMIKIIEENAEDG